MRYMLCVIAGLLYPASLAPAQELQMLGYNPTPIVCQSITEAFPQFRLHREFLSTREVMLETVSNKEMLALQEGCGFEQAWLQPIHPMHTAKVVVNGMVIRTTLWIAFDFARHKRVYAILDSLLDERAL